MIKSRNYFIAIFFLILFSLINLNCMHSDNSGNKTVSNTIRFETNMGTFDVKVFPDKAPKTSARIKELAASGFYNGIIFHRIIDTFMIQGGDPTGTGMSGSGTPIPDEFDNGLKHDKEGVVAMANTGKPNSQDSQFYITLAPLPFLDGKYTVFGEVVSGMDVVRTIGKVKTGTGDRPVKDVVMTKVYLLEE
jgi:cyclophilin family peptidyl-prolyl cis-trans isomerase